MSKEQRKYILKHIDILSKEEQKELFKIIHTTDTVYTRNNNGIFINLSWVTDSVTQKIYNYINYCILSHNTIENAERIQQEIMQNHINKYETQNETISSNDQTEMKKIHNQTKNKNVSSTMKFYIIRKRMSKCQTIMNKTVNDVLDFEM
tara:strand:+ start:2124 stop:2570 length:447 start_codon:yes stop_codon:yes gene_type:complete